MFQSLAPPELFVDYEKLSFTKSEFLNFLIEYHKKKSKIIFHTELSLRELISQNLSKDGIPLSLKMTQGLLKGHNYSIIKVKDILSTLVLLDKIKEKNALSYVQCSFPLGSLKTDKQKKKSILKYISARGSVDGVTRLNTLTEDSLESGAGQELIDELRRITGFIRND